MAKRKQQNFKRTVHGMDVTPRPEPYYKLELVDGLIKLNGIIFPDVESYTIEYEKGKPKYLEMKVWVN